MQNIEQQIRDLREFDIIQESIENIERFLPNLGMNGEQLHEMPKELSNYYGWGLSFWQYPNQFSKLLKKLTELDIKSYLEIGCRWGGTFIIISETLKKINSGCALYACDIIPKSDVLKQYSEFTEFEYLEESSSNASFLDKVPQKLDLVFIDGDHSYEAVKTDFINFKDRAKYILFHDISSDACPGVVKLWEEIKNDYVHFEYVDQYDSVRGSFLGLGLIVI